MQQEQRFAAFSTPAHSDFQSTILKVEESIKSTILSETHSARCLLCVTAISPILRFATSLSITCHIWAWVNNIKHSADFVTYEVLRFRHQCSQNRKRSSFSPESSRRKRLSHAFSIPKVSSKSSPIARIPQGPASFSTLVFHSSTFLIFGSTTPYNRFAIKLPEETNRLEKSVMPNKNGTSPSRAAAETVLPSLW